MKSFITGTDTECGKTYVTCALLSLFAKYGKTTAGFKPVETGFTSDTLIHSDAAALAGRSTSIIDVHHYTEFFATPTTPNMAASYDGCHLDVSSTLSRFQQLPIVDMIFIEGAGGLCVPWNSRESQIDFIKALSIPVTLIVPLKLGSINHALLSLHLLQSQHIPVLGWISNEIDQHFHDKKGYQKTLKEHITVPYLGHAGRNTPLDADIISAMTSSWHHLKKSPSDLLLYP